MLLFYIFRQASVLHTVPVLAKMSSPCRVRSSSESSEGSKVGERRDGVAYDVDGKFSYSQVQCVCVFC